MRIEAVDAFYLRLPDVRDIGDGSQDALLIRVRAGGYEGWGECEASPLPTLAALIAPMSHSACHSVLDSVLGAPLEGPESIRHIHQTVRERSLDLLQADHALSGIDIALWDLLGRREGVPTWSLFASANQPKTAYASRLFGDTPAETFAAAEEVANSRFRAAKFGWGPIGKGTVAEDREHLAAAREGLGTERTLLVDTGCAFGHDLARAKERISLFEEFGVGWWEEPFMTGALAEYEALAKAAKTPLAGGEGAHNADQARHLIDYGGVRYIQIDTGRIGGITPARDVAVYSASKGVRFVNHTFTNNLALSGSLQPYADTPDCFAEVPVAASPLATAIGGALWNLGSEGDISAPTTPGLGVQPRLDDFAAYLCDVEIQWNGKAVWPQPLP